MLKEFKKDYNLMENIGYEEDMINTIADYPDDYTIEEAIDEIADSNIYLYDADLWNIAPKLRFYIEDAIHDYGFGENLIKMFQMGQFEYNYQVMYENINQIIFNIALDYLEMLLEDNNINIEAFIEQIDIDLLLYDYIDNEIELSIDNNSSIEEINILVNEQFFNFIEEQNINLIKFKLEG